VGDYPLRSFLWSKAYQGYHNKAGLTINGIIRLEPSGATVFYWIIAVASGMFVAAALLLTVRRMVNPQVLELGLDALLCHTAFFKPG